MQISGMLETVTTQHYRGHMNHLNDVLEEKILFSI